MIQRPLLLTGSLLGCWLLLAGPAFWVGGPEALLVSGTALLLCWAAGTLSLVLVLVLQNGSPAAELLGLLGGAMLRMGVVAAGALVLHEKVAFYRDRPAFAFWLVAFYFLTLGLDVWLLAGSRPGQPGA